MKPYQPDAVPSPEVLAAFEDGELDAGTRDQVDCWLRDHPEALPQLEDQRWLARLWKASTPAEPAPSAWTIRLARIRQAVHQAGTALTPRPRWVGRLAWTAALAASVLLALYVGLPRPVSTDPVPGPDPFPVASAQEVEIISIAGADARVVAVGDPPLNEPLVLAEPSDVVLVAVVPDHDGMVPLGPMHEGADAPMLVVPMLELDVRGDDQGNLSP